MAGSLVYKPLSMLTVACTEHNLRGHVHLNYYKAKRVSWQPFWSKKRYILYTIPLHVPSYVAKCRFLH